MLFRSYGAFEPDYLARLHAAVPAEVPWLWTGPQVCSTGVTVDDLEAYLRAAGIAPGGRYEIAITDGRRVKGCYFHGATDDLNHAIDPGSNVLEAPDPEFDGAFRPRAAGIFRGLMRAAGSSYLHAMAFFPAVIDASCAGICAGLRAGVYSVIRRALLLCAALAAATCLPLGPKAIDEDGPPRVGSCDD